MSDIMRDVNAACEIVNNDYSITGYYKIFCSSNENLKDLFNHISVKDKEVLSVLSSSDHYFYAYYNGAKNVDTFDKNYLTKYYYYIRKWCIKYLGKFYPDYKFITNTTYIEELLSLVDCETVEEEDAYLFWKIYIDKISLFGNRKLFYAGYYNREGISDMDRVLDIVEKDLVFYHKTIQEFYSGGKKYDVILLSNILEYCDNSTIELVRDNLYNLLNDNGVVVCSKIVWDDWDFDFQQNIFSKKFDYNDLKLFDDQERDFNFSVGYTYTKNVNKK